MLEIYFINLLLILYISSLTTNSSSYHYIIFKIFKNIIIKLLILFLILILTNYHFSTSILLCITYILTNEYTNIVDSNYLSIQINNIN